MRKLILVTFLIVFIASLANANSIGVTPGYIDYGEISEGETVEADFYITTSDIDQDFEVEPEYRQSLRYAMGENPAIDMRNVSEQDISSWIEFEQETININPNTSETYNLPDGTAVTAEGVISFEVDVPPNAEPGYKLGTIEVNPSIGGEGSGAGAQLIAQTVPSFAFKVPGSVNRNIELTELNAVRVGENQAQLIERLRNTGTVTTTFVEGRADITNSQGERVGVLDLRSATLAPGESAEIDQLWTYEDLEGGQYTIEGQGDYRTGEVYISGDFVITDNIQQRQSIDEPSESQTEDSGNTPITMIAILTVLLATLLYILDVSSYWIIMLSGGFAVALYVILSTASNLLVLIPLLSIAVIFYM